MTTRFTKTAFAAAAFTATFGALLAATPALAQVPSPDAGVTCRAGTAAEYNNGVLRCRAEEQVRLASICSPAAFSNRGDINLNVRLELRTGGVDQCAVPGGLSVDSLMAPPLPGVHPAATPGVYRRVVNATGADVFVATKVAYEYPQGALFIGDASRGVACGNGFSSERIAGGRGLRCVKVEEKLATCDGGFSVERRAGVDRCIKRDRDLFGNFTTVVGQYTIPANAGYVGVMGSPANHGWQLMTDRVNSTDHWRKGSPSFQFPRAG